jgi:ABC-type Fe3+ transport system permease subunit
MTSLTDYYLFYGSITIVIIIVVSWIIVTVLYNREKRKPTLPYNKKKSRYRVTSKAKNLITGLLALSLLLLLVGAYYWMVYGNRIMNTIDDLRQGKLADSLSNNTVIGNKNPLDQMIKVMN